MKRTAILIIAAAIVAAAAGAAWFLLRGQAAAQHVDVDRAAFPIKGIDVSAHNGPIDFDSVAFDSVSFVMIKASEGVSHRDSLFRRHHSGARTAGLKVGAYHFFRFNTPGSDQAANMLAAIDTLPLDLPLAIDVEEWGNASDFDRDDVIRQLRGMVSVLRASGRRVMIYTNKNGYGRFVGSNFADVPLWLCSITPAPPGVEWTLWQHSHAGRVRGVQGSVDINTFSGDSAAWAAFLNLCIPPGGAQ